MNSSVQPLERSDNSNGALIRVMALHAFAYCPRLFYLEEVEGIHVQDERVFAGRRLHAEIDAKEASSWEELWLEDEELGLCGKVDALRYHDGTLIPYEHKRGRSAKSSDGRSEAWPSDRIQVIAYAMLIEKVHAITVPEGRVRYHQSNVTVRVLCDRANREEVLKCIEQARALARSIERPPVTDNEKLCRKCSLAPVCLPEEARLSDQDLLTLRRPKRLFPADDERKVIHIVESSASVGKSGNQIKISYRDDRASQTLPVAEVGQIVLHGFSQISTQCIRFCAHNDIGVHFITGGGQYVGGVNYNTSAVQRKLRQYAALSNENFCLGLAKRLVCCKAESQRQVLMRFRRRGGEINSNLTDLTGQMSKMIRLIENAEDIQSLLGIEGRIARLYFSALPQIISSELPATMQFNGRSKRPPRDPINCLLSYGYSFLIKDILNAVLTVGLEPAIGFYHQPRSSAPPLVLDLMELFRVIMVDIPVLNSVNRMQWDASEDFINAGQQVWLSDFGKRKLIEIYERRKVETWKHPAIGYSLSYGRIFELEVRLLEKEWMNEGGLFAKLRLR